jgi:hypothetical protein
MMVIIANTVKAEGDCRPILVAISRDISAQSAAKRKVAIALF